MRDHGLLLAIRRVNRLDGDDKEHGSSSTTRACSRAWKARGEDCTSGALEGIEKKDLARSVGEQAGDGPRSPGRRSGAGACSVRSLPSLRCASEAAPIIIG